MNRGSSPPPATAASRHRRGSRPQARGLPRFLHAVLLLAWWVFPGPPAAAQPTSDQLNFRRFLPRDGLPPAVVYCITQDSRGFLWFGTADGAARFDGHRFRVFRSDPADPRSLGNGAVLGIAEDEAGDLWMATEGGIDVWRRDTESFEHFRHREGDPAGPGDDTTQCLVRDPAGFLWVGTRRAGLERFDPRTGRGEAIELPGLGDDLWVRCLLRDQRGGIWIGTSRSGLHRLDPATREVQAYHHTEAGPAHEQVFALAEDRDGRLWVGTAGGLCQLDPASGRFECIPLAGGVAESQPNLTVTAVLVDRDGRIDLGTDGGGFLRYDPRSGQLVPHRRSRYLANTIAADAVRAIAEDANGDLWIGHFPNGVSHFDRAAAAFQVFCCTPGEANSMADDQVLAFLADPNGDLWVGTDNGGLNHWSAATGHWRNHTYSLRDPRSLGAKAAITLARDRQGVLWVGTWGGGLNRFDPRTQGFQRYQPVPGDAHSLSDPHVWRILEDADGQLWIATIGGGLERFDPATGRFHHHRHDPADPRSLNDDIVSSLLLTRDGVLWAGTPRGLARLDRATGSFDRFQSAPGAPGTLGGYWIFDLLEDEDGTIWATTEGGGLNHFDPQTGRSEVFNTAHGLPSDMLRSILADDAGLLWIGTNQGLARFDPGTRRVRVFDEGNGLPGSQFNPHARLRLPSGEMLFGTTQGFVRFDPRRLGARLPPPRVRFTQLEVFHVPVRPGTAGSVLARSITETSRLELPARFSVIRFQFAAPGTPAQAHLHYRVKLEGFEGSWRDLGSNPYATFTNLAPGRYQLRVAAAGSDGIWSEPGASLELVVVPRWWQTLWFRALVSLGVLGSAAAVGWAATVRHMRLAQHAREIAFERERAAERERTAETLRSLNQQLEARVADRTAQLVAAMKELEAFSYSVSHDLRTPLRSMDGFSRLLLEDYGDRIDEEGRDCLRRIRAATQRMGQLIDDLLNLSRVSRDEMHRRSVDLSAMVTTIAEELRREHPAQVFEFIIQPGLTARGDPRLLQIALNNLLGNAAKFSSKRPVSRIEFGSVPRDGRPVFYVRDNGAGFDLTYARTLFGAFRRFHAASEFPGTGIGLATVQRIIRRHGGDIFAESAPDQGATLYFTLPDPTPDPS